MGYFISPWKQEIMRDPMLLMIINMRVSDHPNICYTGSREGMVGLLTLRNLYKSSNHYEVIKWKHFPCNWPFVRGIHRPVMRSFDVFFDCISINNREAGDLRRHRGHYDVNVMVINDLGLKINLVSWCTKWFIKRVLPFIHQPSKLQWQCTDWYWPPKGKNFWLELPNWSGSFNLLSLRNEPIHPEN